MIWTIILIVLVIAAIVFGILVLGAVREAKKHYETYGRLSPDEIATPDKDYGSTTLEGCQVKGEPDFWDKLKQEESEKVVQSSLSEISEISSDDSDLAEEFDFFVEKVTQNPDLIRQFNDMVRKIDAVSETSVRSDGSTTLEGCIIK